MKAFSTRLTKSIFFTTLCIFFLCVSGPLYAEEADEDTNVEGEKKPGFIKKIVNTAMSLPFGYDFGCEPTLHGSLIYLNVKFKWSEEKQIFSRILFNYGTTLSLEPNAYDAPASYAGFAMKKYEYEEKAIDFKIIPWGKQINSGKYEKRYLTIEPGLNFRIEPEKLESTYSIHVKQDDKEAFYNIDSTQSRNKFIIRPFFSTTLSTPLGKFFTLSLDLLYAPFYYCWGNYDIDYSASGYNHGFGESSEQGYIDIRIPTLNLKFNGSAENYVDANLVLGLFNIVAASGRLIYERQYKTDFFLSTDQSSTNKMTASEKDNTYERLILKIGGSLINIGKASMRIKAGLFYQWEWLYNHNEKNWFHTGKFIFGVGMRNLY